MQTDDCTDTLQDTKLRTKSDLYRAFLNAHMREFSVANCSQIAHVCWNLSQGRLSNLVRLFCPDTCGCTDPRSGSLFLQELPYCAQSCMKTTRFVQLHDEVDCVDMPPEKLKREKWWILNAERLQWQQDKASVAAGTGLAVKQILLDFGCSAVLLAKTLLPSQAGFEFQLCDGFSEQARTFWRSACPVACNCSRIFRSGCPSKCKSNAIG